MTGEVLVTGGAGYIGSHACKALSQAGYKPIALDNLIYGHREAVKWGPLEEGNILDGNWLDGVFKRYRPVAVMHFAAFAYVGESMSDPSKYYQNNVMGTVSLLDAMVRNNVKKIVLSSSCATYGAVDELPITETTRQLPINTYGYTKLICENVLADYERAHGLKWTAMRYFNAAGADSDGEIGESHDPETHLIPLAIWAALGQGKKLQIFGNDYDTPDGTALRDYIHVSDLAAAHLKAVEYLARGGPCTAFNLGTGSPTSVLEVMNAVTKAAQISVPFEFVPRRDGDPPALYACSKKAQMTLGWTPKESDINDIVVSAVTWHRNALY
jgi:UDP-arabinose 4-epimerase